MRMKRIFITCMVMIFIATAVILQFVGLYGLMQSSLVQISLPAVSLWLSVQGINFMREREPDYISVFKRAN